MATTIHLELKKEATSKGLFPVFVRITQDRKSKRIKTSVALKSIKDWNPKGEGNEKWVRTSEPKAAVLNEQLKKELDEAKRIYRENKDASLSGLVKNIKGNDESTSFLAYIKEVVELGKATEAVTTYRHYQSLINKIEGFLASEGLDDISFSEVNLDFLNRFRAYLHTINSTRYAGRKLHPNTIAGDEKRVRRLYYQAVNAGKIPNGQIVFKDNFKIKEQATNKEKLELEEIDAIKAIDLPEGGALWNTRNAFLFSFYCAGIRVGDLLQLRWSNVEGGRLRYSMAKNKKHRDFKLVEDAEAILDYYRASSNKESDFIFPFLDSGTKWALESYNNPDTMSDATKKDLFDSIASRNVIINRNLDKIAKLAGISKKVTFHTSRHSFAHLAMKMGIPTKQIQEMLAHSHISTTERYVGSFGSAETDRALAQIHNSNKSEESQKEALISALKSLDKETLAEVLVGLRNG